jgi:hypothetical protein
MNLSTERSAIYMSKANRSREDGVNVTNSTFIHLKGTSSSSSSESPAIYIYYSESNINISDSVFTNISSSNNSPYAGGIYYNMSVNGNGNYNIKGNTFSNISTSVSILVLTGSFSSFLFSYNTFCNVF